MAEDLQMPMQDGGSEEDDSIPLDAFSTFLPRNPIVPFLFLFPLSKSQSMTMGDNRVSLKPSSMMSGPLSRWNAEHRTVVQAPIQFVWESLIDIASWQWNPCVRLSADAALTGTSGKASIAVRSRRWKIRDFVFDAVHRESFTFWWSTTIAGTCKVTNTIKLRSDGTKATIIYHSQKFSGAFPGLRWSLPLPKMKSYPMCINEALKNHVESRHFNHLLVTLSTREMSTTSEFSGSSDLEESPASLPNYWSSSPQVRRQILTTFLEGGRLTLPPTSRAS